MVPCLIVGVRNDNKLLQVSGYLPSAALQHYFMHLLLPSFAAREVIFVKVACSMARQVRACTQTVTVAQLLRYNLSVMTNLQSQKRRTCNATTATREKTTTAYLSQIELKASKNIKIPTCEQ